MIRARTDILPQAQRHLLPKLAPLRKLGWVLYGGTAIALHLGHRTSVDFDFFTDHALDREALTAALPWLATSRVLQDEPDAWTLLAPSAGASVKISFFGGLGLGRVGDPVQIAEGLSLASLDDLLGHKLKVLLQRVEAKDYRDIAAMLAAEGGDLSDLFESDRALLSACSRKVGKPRASKISSGSLGK